LVGALNLPIRFIGIGEAFDDLQPFSAEEFSRAILSDTPLETDAAER
jgi:signal recognition particle GTPase